MSLVEVVAAIGISVSVVAASALVLSGVGRSVQATRARDTATAIASGVIEQAAAFGCSMSVGNDGDPDRARQLTRCKYDPAVAGSAALSDVEYVTTRNGVSYTVRVATRWEIPGIDQTYITERGGPTCTAIVDYANGRRAAAQPVAAAVQPTLVVRTVTVNWTDGFAKTITLSSRSVIAADNSAFNRTEYGGVMMRFNGAGRWATLTVGSAIISRYTDSQGCAWFPYLPPGTYTVTYSAGSRTTTIAGTCASATPPTGFAGTCHVLETVTA